MHTVNSCTKETGQVVWSVKEDDFNLIADVLDEQDARALADKLNAVAELIEADKEYDAARTAVETRDPWSKKLADVSAVLDRLDYAKERRAAALARVGAA